MVSSTPHRHMIAMLARNDSVGANAGRAAWVLVLASTAIGVMGLVWIGLRGKQETSDSPSTLGQNVQSPDKATSPLEASSQLEREPTAEVVLETAPLTPTAEATPPPAPEKPGYAGKLLPLATECLGIPWCNPEHKSLEAAELARLNQLIATLNTDLVRAQDKLFSRKHDLAVAMAAAGKYIVRAPGEKTPLVQPDGAQMIDVVVIGASAKPAQAVTVFLEEGNDAECVQLHQDLVASYSAGMDAIQDYIALNAR